MIKYAKLSAQQTEDYGLNSHGVSSHLSRVRDGSAPTPRSWWNENIAPEKLLDELVELIKSSTSESQIVTDDLHYLEKIGPQGGTKEWKVNRLPLLEQSFTPVEESPIFASDLWQKAIKQVISELKLRKNLRPKSPEQVIESIRKKGGLSTNSGLPHFTRRANVIDETLALVRSGKWKEYPAVIGSRSMRQAERNIFMYPFSTNIQGSRFQQVIQDHIRSLKLPEYSAWEGTEHVESAIQPGMDQKLSKLSGDYEKMDNWFRIYHTKQVFEVIKWGFQSQYWDELWESMSHTHTIGVLTPDGVTTGDHGVASGSEWTNFLETVFQHILWTYINLKRIDEGRAPIILKLFQGDDSIGFSTEPLSDDFADGAEAVKFKVNRDKLDESYSKVHYLRRWYYMNYQKDNRYVGVYPLTLAENAEIYPERFHDPKKWNGNMFVIRALMIAENPVHHPGHVRYVERLVKGNPHFEEFAKMSKQQVDREFTLSRDIPGLVPTYNQEKLDKPFTEFESYKILKRVYS